jgi:hypothetical protein
MNEDNQRSLAKSGWHHEANPRADDGPPSQRYAISRSAKWLVIATAIWGGCELPIELWLSAEAWEGAACVLGKGIWWAVVWGVLLSVRGSRAVFVFLCGVSVVSIAFGLPNEYRLFPLGFFFSVVECVLKGAALVAFISGYLLPQNE